MSEHIHFIVAKSRNRWDVSVESKLLSEHRCAAQARHKAVMLTGEAARDGATPRFVDLSCTDDD
jgi:hypothetical protein